MGGIKQSSSSYGKKEKKLKVKLAELHEDRNHCKTYG